MSPGDGLPQLLLVQENLYPSFISKGHWPYTDFLVDGFLLSVFGMYLPSFLA